MALIELIMPKMGESIIEATVLKWWKQVGDPIEEEETILEVATDKVDSEIPSPVSGILHEILFDENQSVTIGEPIAIISTDSEAPVREEEEAEELSTTVQVEKKAVKETPAAPINTESTTRFYSPLVKSIAQEEGIELTELEAIKGSGQDGRVTKDDILSYLKTRKQTPTETTDQNTSSIPKNPVRKPNYTGEVEVVEMDRMRKLIANHMVESKRTAPHVSSFVEVDVTNMVKWREANKQAFQQKYNTKITYTPIILEAIATAIRQFPAINCSVDGDSIIYKKNINLGVATALPSGNLIVPVIKNADRYNLSGMAGAANELIQAARSNSLEPTDIQDGTFTFTNIGMFNNIIGTPIIPLPQVAIMAAGVIKKRPVVLETEEGDVIAIRHMMYLSMSYDHRVVDGYLGGTFLNTVGKLLEQFDRNRTV